MVETNVQTVNLELFPEYTVSFALFNDVTNVSALRQKLLKGEISCTMVNTNLIPDVFTVLLACNRAVYNITNSSMKTRSIHTEVLYNLSPTSSITDSLKTFGVADDQKSFLCVGIRKNDENDDFENILKMVDGVSVPTDTLKTLHDAVRIQKLYKITNDEIAVDGLANAVCMRVSTKDFL